MKALFRESKRVLQNRIESAIEDSIDDSHEKSSIHGQWGSYILISFLPCYPSRRGTIGQRKHSDIA